MKKENTKETVIQSEQQSNEVIINEIIKIIAKKNLTIEEADKILYYTLQKIKKQIVTCS